MTATPKPRRWQYSLFNLLVLVIGASFLAAWIGTKFELAESQQEVERERGKTREREATIELLRKESGYVNVRDKSKVNIDGRLRNIRENDKLAWSWHLYLPKGRYRLVWATGIIDETGLPDVPLKRWSIPLPVSSFDDSADQLDVYLFIMRRLNSEPCLLLRTGNNYPQRFDISDIEVKSLQQLHDSNKGQQRGMSRVTASPESGPIDLLRIASDKESRIGLLVYIELDQEVIPPTSSSPVQNPPK